MAAQMQGNAYVRGMDAITLLKRQHREVSGLFERFHKARTGKQKREIFEEIGDSLAIHAAIEEKHFYPSVKKRATADLLQEAVEEHLQIKRVIADLLRLDPGDATFAAKVKVLQDDVEHHVEEEESDLFPKVRKLFDTEDLESLAEAMQATETELKDEGSPREMVTQETERAAPI
jgi:hemerythrin superfamily protein